MLAGEPPFTGADDAGDAGQAAHRAGAERAGGAAQRARGGGRRRSGRRSRPSRPTASLPRHSLRAALVPAAVTVPCPGDPVGPATVRSPRRSTRPRTATARSCCSGSASCSASACSSAGCRRHGGGHADAGDVKRLAVLPFDNLGARGGRVLRRRGHRRDPRQARGAARPPGDRQPQRRRVQEEQQRPGDDRPRAGGGLPAGRQGAVGKGRGRAEPGAGEPGADRGVHRLDRVAAAVRRPAHRRLPGAGRHRRPGGAGARRGDGGWRAPGAGGTAHRERGGVRRLPQGVGGVSQA